MAAPNYAYGDIAKMIDHSLLNPALTTAELEAGCALAREYDVASVCILPYYVKHSAELLRGTTVVASTTIGFPHGGHKTSVKAFEAEQALADGARELDALVNISKVRSSDWGYVQGELQELTALAHSSAAKIKIIFENAYHGHDAKVRLCEICGQIGVDWVKTSTGYAATGATLEDLLLMRKHSPASVQVKAAGGIRTLDALLEVREIGVTRVGATRTAEMLDECRQRLGLAPLLAARSSATPAGY